MSTEGSTQTNMNQDKLNEIGLRINNALNKEFEDTGGRGYPTFNVKTGEGFFYRTGGDGFEVRFAVESSRK